MSHSILSPAPSIPSYSSPGLSSHREPLWSALSDPFLQAFQRSRRAIAIISADNVTFQMVNPTFAAMYGYTVEELPGKPILDVFAPDVREEVIAHLRLENQSEARTYELSQARKDGSTFPVRVDAHPVRDESGRLLYRIVYVEDITERADLLTSLRAAEQEQAYLLSTARCLLWQATVKEMGTQYVHWDLHIPDLDAAQRFLPMDRRPGEAYKDAWYRCREPEDRDRCNEFGSAAVRAGQSYEQEFRCYCADGSMRWLHEDIRVETLEAGRHWRVVSVCTDITERKQAEQALLEKQAAIETLNARLRRAMTETHHRVKNNLQMISALIDMQAMEGGETVPIGELKRLAAQIQSLAVVHDVLTGAVEDAAGIQRVSMRKMLHKLLPKLQEMAGGQGLRFEIAEATMTTRQSTALALMLQELYLNALKHGGQAVVVRFEVREQGTARLEVRDDGPGFPAEFDAIQAANTGLELVLSLARTDLQGEVTFDTLLTGGGRVRVSFPLAQ